MQDTVEVVSAGRTAPLNPLESHESLKSLTAQAQPVSLANVWRDTLSTFGRQSAPILACAFLGFALAGILSALLSTLLIVDLYRTTGSVLVSFGPSHNVPLLVEGMIGALAGAFARGMITALALRPESTRRAVQAVFSRWAVLLFIVACTGGVLFLGNLGLDALLRVYNVDLSDVRQISLSAESLLRTIMLRTVGSFIPDPGAPFTQWITYLRLETSRVSASLIYAGGFSYYRVRTIQEATEPWTLGVVGLLLLTGGDALLRFCLAGVLRAPARSGFRPVLGALSLAGRRLTLVLAHVWVVRLVIFTVNAVFVTVPLVLAQSLLTPLMISNTGSAWPYIIVSALVSISLALVSMVFVAFGVIYDARLYEWLRAGREA